MTTFYRTESGSIIVSGGGEFSGAHDVTEAAFLPDWTVLPTFSEAPTQIGSVATVDLGTVTEGSFATARIGTGTDQYDFVGFIESETGTIPAEMVPTAPVPLVALCTVHNGTRSKTVFIDSGVQVTLAENPLGFPPDLAPSAWSWTEVLLAPDGRRTGMVDAGLSVPAGYRLLGYSGSVGAGGGIFAPGGPTTFNTDFTVTRTYTTGSSLPVGATCYSGFIWHREVDNAYQLAHPLADEEAFVIQGTGSTEPPPPSDDATLNPDATVSTAAAVRAQIQSWIASGAAASGDKVVGLDANTSGLLDLRNLINPHATATAKRIIVRHVGTFTGGATPGDEKCSRIHSGGVSLTGSRGIHVDLMHLRVGGGPWGSAVVLNSLTIGAGSVLCGASQNIIEARAPALSIPGGTDWKDTVVYIDRGAKDTTFTHNLIRYAGHPQVVISNVDGLTFAGNHFDLVAADEVKAGATLSRMKFERNWSTLRFLTGVAGDPHEDFWQHQGRATLNSRFWGNVDLHTHEGKGARQTFWFSGQSTHDFTGSTIEQQMSMLTSNFFINGAVSGRGNGLSYNDIMVAGAGGTIQTAPTYAGMGPLSKNYVTGFGSALTSVSQNDGLGRDVGPKTGRDYSSMTQDFANGIPWMNPNGTQKSPRTINAFRPKVGSRKHWSHSNPVGAYLRSREIYDPSYRAAASTAAGYKVFPFAWPVLAAFHSIYNPDNGVDDDYTGTWDSNGFPV